MISGPGTAAGLQRLESRSYKKDLLTVKPMAVIGLNSGTSMDGIDAAAFSIRPTAESGNIAGRRLAIEMLGALVHPFDPTFGRNLKRLINSGQASLEQVCLVNTALGELFAQAAVRLMKESNLSVHQVDLIGSHGQTIWHSPKIKSLWGVPTSGTLQLGEPAVIAARTGIPVIADFRPQDLAYGGQGAPLVAFADEVIFGQPGNPTGILNLGGIANITIIDDTGQAVLAFDTGPGNMIIDRVAQSLCSAEFDDEGLLAAQGTVDERWIAELLQSPYFLASPPKTTGREAFGYKFTDHLLQQALSRGLSASDCLATFTAFSAASIAESYQSFVLPRCRIKRLVLGGGGAKNKTLAKFIEAYWPHPITVSEHEDFGISTKFKEALLFALLAYTTFFGIPNNVPGCTGAKKRICLGKISMPLR